MTAASATGDAPLLVLTGCTASGKESTALLVAPVLGDLAAPRPEVGSGPAEIVCADSVKPYRGLEIPSAAPSAAARAAVPHHLASVLDAREPLHAGRWCDLARAAIADVRGRGRTPLVVGGTALYLRALLFGLFDGPPADPALRAALEAAEEAAPGTLHRRLTDADPVAAAKLHPNDRKRLVRALEVHAATGEPISARQTQWTSPPVVPYVAVCLERTPEDLRARIERRVDRMAAEGLFEAVRPFVAPGALSATAAEAIGVKEILPVLRREAETGTVDPDGRAAALAEVKRRTWTFARRQRTWWRSFPAIRPLPVPADEPPERTAERVLLAFRRM